MSVDRTEIELRALISRTTGKDVSRLDADADLAAELGLDSLASLSLLAKIERHFDFRFDDEKLSGLRTLRTIEHEIVKGKRGGGS